MTVVTISTRELAHAVSWLRCQLGEGPPPFIDTPEEVEFFNRYYYFGPGWRVRLSEDGIPKRFAVEIDDESVALEFVLVVA